MERVRQLLRDVPDFPKPGIIFKDITPVLQDPAAFAEIIDYLAERYADAGLTQIVGIESRGFIFASALALKMRKGLVLIRKPGKLPAETFSASYELEYGKDEVHIHKDSLSAEDRVVILDDLLATGGTLGAAAQVVGQTGAIIEELAVLIELDFLKGREKITNYSFHSLLNY
tara:strand:+ start:392 stop:907 length:516 start_codon:yes stop_codon:yes gene_type:complete